MPKDPISRRRKASAKIVKRRCGELENDITHVLHRHTEEQIEAVAALLGITDPAGRMSLARQVSNATSWFYLDSKSGKPPSPSDIKKRLGQLLKAINRIFEILGVDDPADGPPPGTLRFALEPAAEDLGDSVPLERRHENGEERLRRSIENLGLLRAAARRAQANVEEIVRPGRGGGRHKGDVPLNNYIASLLDIFEQYRPVTLAINPYTEKPTAPVISFIENLLNPFRPDVTRKQIHDRVRALRKSKSKRG